ncbi:MAG TPA: hypothetical protein V6C72_13380 [Chroococcales cyanobacterium]
MRSSRKNSSPCRTRLRSQSGVTGFIEIGASGLFIVILALLGMDIAMAIFGASLNDRACHDATRAAASASTRDKAWSLASAAVKNYRTDGIFLLPPQLLSGPQDFDYADYNGNPPADTSPSVTVTTETIVRIPAPIFFFGASFMKDGKAQFKQRYTYPIVKSQLIKF